MVLRNIFPSNIFQYMSLLGRYVRKSGAVLNPFKAPFMLKVPLKMFLLIYTSFDKNFQIEIDFTKYLKRSNW